MKSHFVSWSKSTTPPLIRIIALLVLSFPGGALALDGIEGDERVRFWRIHADDWREVFFDACTSNWEEKWSLDGLKATIRHSAQGMDFAAGPVTREDASHAVLWTKESFSGDLKIEYEYTRTDEAEQFVTILYIQATGSGKSGYSPNIHDWSDQRSIPSMKTYFNHMNTYHISYAAFGSDPVDHRDDYIRARRYMPDLNNGLQGTELLPDAFKQTGLFATGEPHRITVIKKGNELFMMIKNQEKEYLCHWVNTHFPPIVKGPVGLRHMFTRSARYRNFRVSQLPQG